MIAVDTNILVRLLTRDHEAEYAASYQLFATEEIFIPDTVILETEWVLRFAYDLKPSEICDAFRQLFGLANVTISSDQRIAQVISWHELGLDFADAFHLVMSQGCDELKTFDKNFIKKSKGLTDCRVERP